MSNFNSGELFINSDQLLKNNHIINIFNDINNKTYHFRLDYPKKRKWYKSSKYYCEDLNSFFLNELNKIDEILI